MHRRDENMPIQQQAMARVWRDGQKRRVFEYRFFATGTIEEKVFQRQLSKEGLQGGLFEAELAVQNVSSDNLRDLFTLKTDTLSETLDSLKLDPNVPLSPAQVFLHSLISRWRHKWSVLEEAAL
jgi:DNA repair and recombination protein RAD54 and RAD54-like protein